MRRYHYETRDQLQAHIHLFADAHNQPVGSRFCLASHFTSTSSKYGRINPERFGLDPSHHTQGSYIPNSVSQSLFEQWSQAGLLGAVTAMRQATQARRPVATSRRPARSRCRSSQWLSQPKVRSTT